MPERITFYDLHRVIQAIFEWDDIHLHAFAIPSRQITIGSSLDSWNRDDYEETETLLEEFLFDEKSIRYTYDFGDCWLHKIIFEKTDGEYCGRTAVLLKAKGDNFHEDTGGVWHAGDLDNRFPFDADKVKNRLGEMIFSIDEELVKNTGSLASDNMRKKDVSKMAEKITDWKSFVEETGNKTVEIVRGTKSNAELLCDLSRQETEDYCKYLQIPVTGSWGKERLAEEISRTLKAHPEYILYVFFEKELKGLKRFRKLRCGEVDGSYKFSDEQIKALHLGMMNVEILNDSKEKRARVSFAADIDELFPLMDAKETKRHYRRLRTLSDELGALILTYGLIEVRSMYSLFYESFGETISEDEFNRLLYWHARFNNMLETVYTGDGTSYAVLSGVDAENVLKKTARYSEDLDYKRYTEHELRNMAYILEDSVWMEILYCTLYYTMELPRPDVEQFLEAVCFDVVNGRTLAEIM